MTLLLDIAAVAAVIAALIFLLRPGRKACAAAPPASEFRIPLQQLRESARRASGREAGQPTAR